MELSKDFHILCIGNSHTAGYPDYDPLSGGNPESSYEFWLKDNLTDNFPRIKFILENQGTCGLLARQILSRLRTIFDNNNPDLIVFWGGANDLVFHRNISSIWQTLWEAYELAKKNGIAFCMVTIPPMNFDELISPVKQLNQLIRDNAEENYYCADVYYPLERNDSLTRKYSIGDGAHLSVQGYQIVGDVIYSTLKPQISKILTKK